MLRILTFVIIVALVVSGAVWLADRPGAVAVDWLGWRAETSVPVLLAILFAIAAALTIALRVLTGLLRLPGRWVAGYRAKRQRRGYQALSDGLAAAAIGHGKTAHKLAGKARKLLADPSLTAFLSAQAAQLAGDQSAAKDHFTAMLERPETAALGLRGLLTQALERGDTEAAIELAGRARLLGPSDPWLADTLFKLLVKADRLREAQELVADAAKRKAFSPAEATRRRALVLNERAARALAEDDTRSAIDLSTQALKADPGLTAAALRLAQLTAAANKPRRAAAILEKAWTRQPAPALAQAYAGLREGEEPLPRVRRMEKLVAGNPAHPESHLALAEVALEAKLWGQARKHLLAAAESRPSARPYRLLAQVEQAEYNDQNAARGWLQKAAEAAADPAWVCASCGGTAAEWSLVCPHCGTVDSLGWTIPRAVVLPVAAVA
ncbi:MAG TPA: heme biosynthesis HemY N-terminal domain-containing protein [Patescibacteria group bacterium]|nr:heme biosynthesis HemY N-terminal domain-containing protein [Patescibacteria group bacterium]